MGPELATAGRLGQLHRLLVQHFRAHLSTAPRYVVGDDFRTLHTHYSAWRMRVPSALPRKVHRSRELDASALAAEYRAEIDQIVGELERGQPVRRRLSGRIAYAPLPRAAKDKRGMDRLLTTHGYHHLHVSRKLRSDGTVERGDHVLIVAFRGANAYLIDLVGHESSGANWSGKWLIEIPARNWPDAGVVWPVGHEYGARLKNERTDDERQVLSRAGINVGMATVDGSLWSAGSFGPLLDNTPACAALLADQNAWTLSGGDNAEQRVREALGDDGTGRWWAVVHGEAFGFYSPDSERWVRIGALVP